MPKYLSGRQKRRPQDKLTEDRYQYLGLDQAEPNLADPATSPGVPAGAQFQLIAVSGFDGQRFWVPVGGDLQPGSITIFDEGSQVSGTSSITQLNFVGAAVTAAAGVQSPSGHPGVAATITVIPVTVGDNPPIGAGTTNNGELWWESDTGDLYVYYNDGDSSQWVMANSGGRGLTGDKGATGDKGIQGQKGEIGSTGDQGDKGSKGEPSTVKGDKGDKGDAIKGDKGDAIKGDKGDTVKGDKGEMNVINSNADDRVITGSDTPGELNAESKLTFDSDNVTATLNVTGNTNITGITTINNNLIVNKDLDIDGHTNLDNVSIAGVTTFVGAIDANGGANIDNIQIGVTNDNEIDTSTGNLTIDSAGGTTTIDDNVVVSGNLNVTGVLTYEDVTNIDSVGIITAREGIFLPDNKKLEFGNAAGSGDLRIFHDTQNSYIDDEGTGALQLRTVNGTAINLIGGGNAATDYMARFVKDGAASLYYNKSVKFVTTDDGVKISGGLQDKDGELGTSGQVLTSTGTELNWVNSSSIGTDTNTTYDLITSTSGSNVNLKLDASSGDDDTILITAGSNITLTENGSGTGFTIASTDTNTDTNTTYDLITSSSGSNVQLLLDASSGDDDPILITAGTNVSFGGITATGFTINTLNTQLSTEEVQDIVGAMFSNNTETRISANYQDSDGTIDLVVDDMTSDNNTTYDLVTSTSGSNIKLKLDASTGSSDDDEITITAGTNVTLTDNSNGGFTIDATNTNTQLTTEQVQDIVGAMVNGGTETRIGVTYDDTAGKLNFVVDDQSSDNNTTYDLEVIDHGSSTGSGSGNDSIIRLNPSSGTNDDVRLIAGSNVTLSHSTADDTITISTSGTLDVTQLDLNRIRFGPGNAANDDANIEWLGGNNAGYLRISTSDDSGTEYIELGDYDFVDASGTFTQWAKLNRSELYMARPVRLGSTLKDAGNSPGTNGQVLVSTGSAVDWVDASTVGGSVDTKYDLLVPSGTTKIRLEGATESGNTNDDVEIAGGTGISVTRNSSNKLTIANTDTGSGNNTTYLLKAEQVSGSNSNPNLFLDASSGTDDRVRLVGGGSVTVTRNNDGQITISGTDTNTDTNTTYDLSVLSGTTKIRLSGSNSTNDDVEIAAGSGISVTRNNANKLTITNTDGGSSVTGGTTRTIIRAFGSSTQYSPTSGTKFIQVYCVAGGGGSGRASGDDSGEQSDFAATGGGGGGGACIGYYNITGSFSASIQVGPAGQGGPSSGQPAGGSSGGESRFTPSGSYSGDGTLDANGGGASGTGAGPGGGGGASGGFPLTGDNGQRMSSSSSGGQYFQTPGKGGLAAYNFGIFGKGGNGAGPTGGQTAGQAGQGGVIVVYEYLT